MTEWVISRDLDDAAAYAVLAQDRIWNGYSIADLEPPFRQYAQIWSAARPRAAPSAATLLMRHPAFSALIPHGDPAGVAALLDAQDLPQRVFVLARPEHLPALAGRFVLPPGDYRMLRMAVDRATFQPVDTPDAVHPGRLGEADLPALVDLYGGYPGNAFNADQLRSGVFYGIRADGELLAAGGTHVVAARCPLGRGIAAVGNIYTRPSARGRGYALAVTAAVVGELLERGFADVILNVAAGNASAISVYRRLGFAAYCEHWEAAVERR